jgi:hypothetical protein
MNQGAPLRSTHIAAEKRSDLWADSLVPAKDGSEKGGTLEAVIFVVLSLHRLVARL